MFVLPGGDDPDGGIEGDVGQLEPHLIVPLSRGPVANRIGPFQLCDLQLPFGDQRPGERRPQEIGPLVDRIRAEGRKDEIPGKLLLKIVDVDLCRPGFDRLFPKSRQLLLLADVGGKADHLAAVGLDEPPHDHGRIQTSRIGEDHFFHFVHSLLLLTAKFPSRPSGRADGSPPRR